MKNFYAIFKGVLATLVATSMLAVSCTEAYDDTQIRQEIADLYEKVSKLEQKLESEVSALKALIDEKTVVASAVKNNDGSWEILLTSGEKITVYPQYQPEPQAPEVNNGCVTVIKEGDTYFWAQIVDGKAVAITDAAGNKIPVVHSAVPQFRVNPATGDVELSVDGGHSWVIIEKKEQEVEAPTCIFIGVVDGETSVDFTLANGEVISVPKAESIDFGVQAGKTFVTPGESVSVALKAENINDLTVIAKPEGWKASISGKTLTVTAPTQAKIDAGEAELDGLVKIHAAGGDGKCMVGKLAVSASAATIILEINGENLTIYNNALSSWGDIAPAYYGIMPQSEFSAAAVAAGMNDYSLNMLYSYEPQITVSLQEVYNNIIGNYGTPVEIPTGESYVIWAISEGQSIDWMHPYVYTESDVLFTVYTPAFLTMEATKIAFNDIDINVAGGGHSGYIYGVLNGGDEAMLRMQLEESFGNWLQGWGTFGTEGTDINYKGDILGFGENWNTTVYPGTNYLVYVLPLVEGKNPTDYTAADIQTLFVTSKDIEAGGSATLTMEATEITYTNMEVALIGSDNTSMIYAWFATAQELAQFKNEEELFDYVVAYNIEYGQVSMGNTTSAYISSLNPGDAATVVAFAVDTNGKYGQIYKQEFKTKSLNYNEALKVVIDEAATKIDVTTANIKVSTTGGQAVSYRYMAVEKNGWSWKGEESAEATLALGQSYYVNEVSAAELIDGVISVTELATNEEYAFAVLAVDAEGNPSRASYYYFTPKLPEYPLVRATAANYAAMKPTVETTILWDEDYGRFNANVNITPAAGTVKYWVAVLGNEYLSNESVARDAVDYMLINEGQYIGSRSFTEATTYVGGTYDVNSNIWITWLDEAGNYYECICEPLFTAPYVAATEAAWAASEPTVEATLAANTLTYTVTPGTGATKIYVLVVPNQLYYGEETLTYMLTINPQTIVSETAVSGTLAGVPENATIAVAWTDAEGKLYQVKEMTY